jgi:hypothetical protein
MKCDNTRYRQVKDGEEIMVPVDLKQKSACCDCGLVHRYEYAIIVCGKQMKLPQKKFLALMRSLKLRITKRAWRDDHATAGKRRGRKTKDKIHALAARTNHKPKKTR